MLRLTSPHPLRVKAKNTGRSHKSWTKNYVGLDKKLLLNIPIWLASTNPKCSAKNWIERERLYSYYIQLIAI